MKRGAIIGAFFGAAIIFSALGWRGVLLLYVVLVGTVMVLAILLQAGRGGGLASLGGMGADSLLGARSATPISRATYVLAALFVFICMLLARLGVSPAHEAGGAIGPGEPPVQEEPAPAPGGVSMPQASPEAAETAAAASPSQQPGDSHAHD